MKQKYHKVHQRFISRGEDKACQWKIVNGTLFHFNLEYLDATDSAKIAKMFHPSKASLNLQT